MLVAAILAVTVAAASASATRWEPEQQSAKWMRECQRESGMSQEMILEARRGEAVDTPQIRKQALCVARKTKVIGEAGLVDREVVRDKLRTVDGDELAVEAVVDKCCVDRESPEDTALDLYRCLHREQPRFASVR